MKKTFQQIVHIMARHPKKLFLIDGCGAIISAFSLGVILVNLESIFGMPKEVLYWLALIAIIFAIYSFSCSLKLPKNWQSFLKAIAIANLLYCCVTLSAVIYYQQQLTILGLLYFFGEMIIIIFLARVELKVAGKS